MKISAIRLWSRLSAMMFVIFTSLAAAATVDTAKSQITATFRQMNVPVAGRFNKFSGSIDFNPKNPSAGRARIEIDTASFDLDAPEYSEELRKKEWFDTATYPKAVFTSSSVAVVGNHFEAKGKFTLKSKTEDIKIIFTQRVDHGASVYEGELPISRKTYSIGSAEWDSTLEDKVIVKFRIVTPAK
ncbi:MAG: polyisoprenoid-binding protein [Gammaproteobacteria bacterium]|nr:polyisoprenoid-binding protein [Gammaproteobacteria bacterium]